MNCSQLYIGSDVQLPEQESELFSVIKEPSSTEEFERIHKVLGTKHIYYLAPHSGCGCGWDFLDVDTPYDDMSKQSSEALGAFLAELEANGVSAKLYSVCIEEVGLAPKQEQQIAASELMAHLSEYRAPYSSKVSKVFRLGK